MLKNSNEKGSDDNETNEVCPGCNHEIIKRLQIPIKSRLTKQDKLPEITRAYTQ